jgi:hypothetical protein
LSNFDVEIRLVPVNPIGGLTYGTVILRQWADLTGNPINSQFNRLNSQIGAQPYYFLMQATAAQLTAGISIQLAALIDSVVVPDAGLAGDLFFTASFLEYPFAIPFDIQEVAVSAVHNITVRTEGHFTQLLARDNHGSKIVHFDVQEVPP